MFDGNGVFCGRNPFLASATLEREGFFRVVALSWYCSFCVDGCCLESAWYTGVCSCERRVLWIDELLRG